MFEIIYSSTQYLAIPRKTLRRTRRIFCPRLRSVVKQHPPQNNTMSCDTSRSNRWQSASAAIRARPATSRTAEYITAAVQRQLLLR